MEKDVHTEHCCTKHGCKFSQDDTECTVTLGLKPQSYPCESCNWEKEMNLNQEELRMARTRQPLLSIDELLEMEKSIGRDYYPQRIMWDKDSIRKLIQMAKNSLGGIGEKDSYIRWNYCHTNIRRSNMPIAVAASSKSIGTFQYPTEKHKDSVEKLLHTKVEACDNYSDNVIAQPGFHSLIAAVDRAFQHHYPFVLTPDTLWLTIAQGLATHITLNAESLRSKFVAHEGKKELHVHRDDFVRKSPENPWNEVFPEFTDQIKDHIGAETHNLIVSDFSTTGKTERAASEIVLMDAMKSYFKYSFHTCCGIPYVSLEGTVEDWEKVLEKTKRLAQYDLTWWTESIIPHIEEIVEAAKGNSNQKFWEDIYKENNGSGGPFVNGWLVKFVPYIENYRGDKSKNSLVITPRMSLLGGVTHDQLPSSASKCPFDWDYYGTYFKYEFIAGVLGMTQDKDTQAIRPRIGWAIREVAA
jgi:Domain of unknown function (DUF4419)